jgi:hypothetical protein
MIIGQIPATSPLTVITNQEYNPDHLGWIGGGQLNTLYPEANYGSIGGGLANYIKSLSGFVGGGEQNEIEEDSGWSTISGGHINEISAPFGAIGGGSYNEVSGEYGTVAGGGGNIASGFASMVPGGNNNEANGQYSFAAGCFTRANHDRVFIWSDDYTANTSSTGAGQFIARASGGFWLGSSGTPSITSGHLIDTSTGYYLDSGGWHSPSDRNLKENFESVDAKKILKGVAELPVEVWTYKSDESRTRHIGPMAQDFAAAFGVGSDNTHIGSIDADGIAFAAIKGLAQVIEEKEKRIDELAKRLSLIEESLNRK